VHTVLFQVNNAAKGRSLEKQYDECMRVEDERNCLRGILLEYINNYVAR
jgi:hypothetical protein